MPRRQTRRKGKKSLKKRKYTRRNKQKGGM